MKPIFRPELLTKCVMGDAERQIFKTESEMRILRDEDSGTVITAYLHPDGRILLDNLAPPYHAITR